MKLDPNLNIQVDNMLAAWGGIPYAELSVLLVHLRFAAFVTQTAHWASKGDSFYGDHLLLDRIYDSLIKDVDAVAERAVGLGNENNVNVQLQALQFMKLVQGVGMSTMIPQPNQHMATSLAVVLNLIETVDILLDSLKANGTLTQGLENMLQGVSDHAEEHCYLLKRRMI